MSHDDMFVGFVVSVCYESCNKNLYTCVMCVIGLVVNPVHFEEVFCVWSLKCVHV